MACSTKVVGGTSAVVLILSFVMIIMGAIVISSSIPTSDCVSGGGISSSDQDAVDTALAWIGTPALIGGILGVIGGGLGSWGGFKANKNGIMCEAIVTGIAGGILVVAAFMAMIGASIFASLCDEYECGAPCGMWTQCQQSDVCCRCEIDMNSMSMSYLCKESHEWSCEMKTKKTVALVFAFLATVMALVAAGCGCAGCCCPSMFTELAPAEAPQGGVPGGVAIGQPVYVTSDQPTNKA